MQKVEVNNQRPGECHQLLPTQPQASAPLRPTSLLGQGLALALVAWEGLAWGSSPFGGPGSWLPLLGH